MPKDRTCTMAEVATHWCACPISEELDPGSARAIKMANVLVDFINRMVQEEVHRYVEENKGLPVPKCATWTLHAVLHASEVQGDYGGTLFYDHISCGNCR
jgi:hypothetical protein